MPALGVLIKTDENKTLLRTKINYSGLLPEANDLKTWVLSAYKNTQSVLLPSNEVPMSINKYIANHLSDSTKVYFISTELTRSTGIIFEDMFVVGENNGKA